LQSSILTKFVYLFYVSDNTSLRLLQPKVATTAKYIFIISSIF